MEKEEDKKTSKMFNRVSGNYWIVSTLVLGIILIVVLSRAGFGGQRILSGNVVGQRVVDFANSQGADARLVSVSDDGDLYEVVLSIEEQEISVYATRDGKYFIPPNGLIPLETQVQTPTTNTQTQQDPSGFSENDLVKLKEFNDCLSENRVVIYGSNTCPHCRALVESLGGYGVAESVYVECTQNRERCNQEAITGKVPEIQINGELYQGARTLEDLGAATGCPVPRLEGSVGVASSDVQC